MLEKNRREIFEQMSVDKQIICIGAGHLGRKFLMQYCGRLKDRIIVCDNNTEKQGEKIVVDGMVYHILSVESVLNQKFEDTLIVIACSAHAEIYQQLMDLGAGKFSIFVYPFFETREVMFENQIRQCFSDYYYYNHMDLRKRNEFIEKEYNSIPAGDLVIPYMPVYLTTRCTLNCEKCNNLMPYLKKQPMDTDVKKVIHSLEKILSCIREMTFCELVGGEPFLYQQLGDMLDFCGQQKKIRQIVVVTNGTIIPDDEILKKLQQYNVLVRISDYGMFEKMAKLVSVLERYNINVRVLQDMKWNDPGDIAKRGKTPEEIYFQYNRCIFSLRCKYLTEDKLFTCARIASLYLLKKYEGSEDMLRIDDSLTKEKIKAFYLHDYGNGCDYCDLCSVDKGKEIPAAVQVGGSALPHSDYTIIRNDYLERLKKNQR